MGQLENVIIGQLPLFSKNIFGFVQKDGVSVSKWLNFVLIYEVVYSILDFIFCAGLYTIFKKID